MYEAFKENEYVLPTFSGDFTALNSWTPTLINYFPSTYVLVTYILYFQHYFVNDMRKT